MPSVLTDCRCVIFRSGRCFVIGVAALLLLTVAFAAHPHYPGDQSTQPSTQPAAAESSTPNPSNHAAIPLDELLAGLDQGMKRAIERASAPPQPRGGILAWTWSYYAFGSLNAAEATGDRRFLDLVARDLAAIAKLRDDRQGIADPSHHGRILPTWSGVNDYNEWQNGPAINGRILHVMARFAECAQKLDPQKHRALIDTIIADAMQTIEALDVDRRSLANDDGDYYVEPTGKVHALNHIAAIGAAMATLYRVTHDADLKSRIERLAKYFQKAFRKLDDGSYIWPYIFDPNGPQDDQPEFIWKAHVTILFPIEAHEAGLGFSDDDMQAIVKTFWNHVYHDGELGARIGPPFEPLRDRSEPAYNLLPWMELDRYDPRIRSTIVTMVNTRTDLFPRAWPGHRLGWMMYPRTLLTMPTIRATSTTPPAATAPQN